MAKIKKTSREKSSASSDHRQTIIVREYIWNVLNIPSLVDDSFSGKHEFYAGGGCCDSRFRT